MRLGILNACTPEEEAAFQVQEFQSFSNFLGMVDHTMTLVEYRVTEAEFPLSADECDAYLITGSPKGVYDAEVWIGQLGNFNRESYHAGSKMVGICFGHQILAHSLGGHTEKSEKGWGMGPNAIEIVDTQSWMTPALPRGNFYFCHQDQVTRLPADAQRLAGNTFCPNGMFMISDKVLGLQAHPEFTSKVMAQALTLLQNEAGEDVVDQAAVATAERQVDNAIMAQWIVNFLVAEQ